MRSILKALAMASLALVLSGNLAIADKPYITVASTTSTQNSGLFDEILPKFTRDSGIDVRVVAVGTGAAIRLARAGDADVLLVHHKTSEEKFVADGFAEKRVPLMYNDFVLVGPKADPAGIKVIANVTDALKAVSTKKAVFTSRGDNSGTHKKEASLWAEAGVDVAAQSGTWYRETGSGMGATLNTSAAMGAYTLTDRGTWLSFKNRQDLVILVEGDKRLLNEYGVMVVSKRKHPHVKADLAEKFVAWLRSSEGKAAINGFQINGKKLFHALD